MNVSWIFPGQGSQKIGMGKNVIDLEGAKERFEYASNLFGRDLFEICESPFDPSNAELDLNNTKNTQICLFLVESILVDSLKNKGLEPNYVAGHSLGEFTALYAADVLTLKDSIALIKNRSELMSRTSAGSMAALIGFDRDQLNTLIKEIDDVVIANDNSSSQVVLSGNKEKLDEISKKITCKRFINLNVSGAFHSPFMEKASKKFNQFLDMYNFSDSSYPVISNSNPSYSRNAKELKLRLKDQMCNGVRWRETMDLMKDSGDLHIVEIGPSNVLGGLAKRHLKNIKITQICSSETLNY